jgi:O-acetylhomoserine (thiol)-lyase
MNTSPGFDTLALHAGAAPDPATGARATAIHVASSFALGDCDRASALFNMERTGHVDAALSNPTNAVLEERIAALEGGVAGIATATGQAALHLGLTTIAACGAHIVASNALNARSHQLLAHGLQRCGVATTFVDPRDIDAWRAAIRPETRLLLAETLSETGSHVLDIPLLAQLAHDHDLPLMVDASLTTPCLLRPFEHGADLLFHSATSFLGGHGSAMGGLLVDAGSFDWQRAHERSGRYGDLCEPGEAESGAGAGEGIVFAEESTVAAFALRARQIGLMNFGAAMSPHNAFAILQGIETLALRMARHVANTRKVVAFLLTHPAVASVCYPELDTHPDHKLARVLLPKGCGGVFTFTVKGERAGAWRCIDNLQLFAHADHVGDARSLALHPASTTHARARPGQLAAAGIAPGTVRLSIGLEDPDDLIADLARALKLSQKGA